MNDADWVEDVKRWYLAGAESNRSADAARSESESWFIGYEAAWPVGDDASPGVEAARLAGPDLP